MKACFKASFAENQLVIVGGILSTAQPPPQGGLFVPWCGWRARNQCPLPAPVQSTAPQQPSCTPADGTGGAGGEPEQLRLESDSPEDHFSSGDGAGS